MNGTMVMSVFAHKSMTKNRIVFYSHDKFQSDMQRTGSLADVLDNNNKKFSKRKQIIWRHDRKQNPEIDMKEKLLTERRAMRETAKHAMIPDENPSPCIHELLTRLLNVPGQRIWRIAVSHFCISHSIWLLGACQHARCKHLKISHIQ